MEEILKEFTKKFGEKLKCGKCQISYDFNCPCQFLKRDIEAFIKEKLEELKKQIIEQTTKDTIRPGDVSSWIEYGKKMGYDKHLLEEYLKKITQEKPSLASSDDEEWFRRGYGRYWDDIKKLNNK